jgi:hypothetical protein
VGQSLLPSYSEIGTTLRDLQPDVARPNSVPDGVVPGPRDATLAIAPLTSRILRWRRRNKAISFQLWLEEISSIHDE